MKTQFNLKTAIAAAAATFAMCALVPAAHAANTSKADYTSSKDQIKATYKTDKAQCDSMSGNAKDICVEEAKGKENVALAEAEFNYTGKSADQAKVSVAKADAAYAVAKEKCDDLAGNPKDVCVAEAKAAHTKGKADAKMGKQVSAARTDAMKDKRDADYKVATEKCDAMAGDAKSACVSAAKAQFGKS